MSWITFIFLLCFVYGVRGRPADPSATRVLALFRDSQNDAIAYSTFLQDLEGRGFSITTSSISSSNVSLMRFGQRVFDHVLFFASNAQLEDMADDLTPPKLLEFIHEGGNMIVMAHSDLGHVIRELGSELGLEFDTTGEYVLDYFQKIDNDTSRIQSDEFHHIVNEDVRKGGAVAFHGIGHVLSGESSFSFPVLTASRYAFTGVPYHQPNVYPFAVGKRILLVSGFQARNNARVLVLGTHEMLHNTYLELSHQRAFIEEVTKWALNERRVLRILSKSHHREGENQPPEQYRIKDRLHYEITIEEYQDDQWQPFIANDVQLELIMLAPHIRTSLVCRNGTFTADLWLPDRYGVYTFKVDYYRHSYSYLHEVDVVPIRPFRHNEYERFIVSAYPYYISSFSMMVGLFLFSWIFLYHRDMPLLSKNKAH